MNRSPTIRNFLEALEKLPSDEPVYNSKVWYSTQKEHWLGWLREYDGPGAYNRRSDEKRDAKFAYNHIVEFKMLLWLIEAAGVSSELVADARSAASKAELLQQKSAAIRKIVPWEVVASALWSDKRKPSPREKLASLVAHVRSAAISKGATDNENSE